VGTVREATQPHDPLPPGTTIATPSASTPPVSAPTQQPIEAHLLYTLTTGPSQQKPDNVIHLIYLIWMTLSWRKAMAAAFVLYAVGAAFGLVLVSAGYLLISVSPLWAAGGAYLLGGAGAAVGAYRRTRRGSRERPSRRRGGQ
jgi:hypothetical protein